MEKQDRITQARAHHKTKAQRYAEAVERNLRSAIKRNKRFATRIAACLHIGIKRGDPTAESADVASLISAQ